MSTRLPARSRRASRGFSLLELVYVFVLLAILSALATTSLMNVNRNVRDTVSEESLQVFSRSAQSVYSVLPESPTRWDVAVEQAAEEVFPVDENGASGTYEVLRYTPETAATTYSAATDEISYVHDEVDGVALLGLAMLTTSGNCAYVVVSPSALVYSSTSALTTGSEIDCNGAVALSSAP